MIKKYQTLKLSIHFLSLLIVNTSLSQNTASLPCEIVKGENNKYAIKSKSELVTGFDFDTIILAKSYDYDNNAYFDWDYGFFLAQTDSGKIVINCEGAILYPHAIDEIWINQTYSNSYVVQRGEHWGFFSLDSALFSAPLNYYEGWNNFLHNDFGYIDLKDLYILEKDGKTGMVNIYQTPIVPFIFDYIFPYGKNVMVKNNTGWKMINPKNLKEVFSFDADDWIGTILNAKNKSIGLYIKDNKVYPLNMKNGKSIEFSARWDKGSGIYRVITDRHEIIIFDKEGNIVITPGEYDGAEDYCSLTHNWINVKKDGKEALLDVKGSVIVDFIYDEFSWLKQTENADYFKVKIDGLIALAKWGVNDETPQLITKFEYILLSHCQDGVACIARGSKKLGGYFWILEDGSEVVK